MKGTDWSYSYNKYKDIEFDSKKLEEEITKLMQDENATSCQKFIFMQLQKMRNT